MQTIVNVSGDCGENEWILLIFINKYFIGA